MTPTGEGPKATGPGTTRWYILIAMVFALLALVFWLALPLINLNSPGALTGSPLGWVVQQLGVYIMVPIIVSVMILRRTILMRRALKSGTVTSLKELNSLAWAIVALGLSNPATGILLILANGPIGKLHPIGATKEFENRILVVEHLTKFFPVRRTFSQALRGEADLQVHAVDDVTFEVRNGQVYGLAGESGSGKTTILRTVLMLTPPTAGSIFFKGSDISMATRREMKTLRTKIQVVFQDPYESMNPRMTVYDTVAEGLAVNRLASSREEAFEKVTKALADVQLTPPEEFVYRYPHELSGGQRQRVAIARALVLEPELILADEPVSMLDVSVRAEVMTVLLSLREKRGITVMMVTHDLALSKDVVDRIGIMYLGRIVEEGPAGELVASPNHPYTQALIAAVPVPDPTGPRIRVLAKGEIPTNISPPSGCRFHPRCSFAQAICSEVDPPLSEVGPGRKVACHFWKEANEAFSKGLVAPQVVGPEK